MGELEMLVSSVCEYSDAFLICKVLMLNTLYTAVIIDLLSKVYFPKLR